MLKAQQLTRVSMPGVAPQQSTVVPLQATTLPATTTDTGGIDMGELMGLMITMMIVVMMMKMMTGAMEKV